MSIQILPADGRANATGKTVKAAQNSRLLPYLNMILLAQCVILLALVQRDKQMMNAIHLTTDTWARQQKVRQDQLHDPVVGSSVKWMVTPPLQAAIAANTSSTPEKDRQPATGNVLLVFFGPCSTVRFQRPEKMAGNGASASTRSHRYYQPGHQAGH